MSGIIFIPPEIVEHIASFEPKQFLCTSRRLLVVSLQKILYNLLKQSKKQFNTYSWVRHCWKIARLASLGNNEVVMRVALEDIRICMQQKDVHSYSVRNMPVPLMKFIIKEYHVLTLYIPEVVDEILYEPLIPACEKPHVSFPEVFRRRDGRMLPEDYLLLVEKWRLVIDYGVVRNYNKESNFPHLAKLGIVTEDVARQVYPSAYPLKEVERCCVIS